jgi:hypothetical protein
VLDALPEEEKSRLESKGGELIEELDLFVHLLLKESTSEVFQPDGCSEKSDAGPTNIRDVVDRRLGLVKGEGDWREERKVVTWSMVEGSSVRMTMWSR